MWSVNHALAGAEHADDPTTPNTIPNNFPHWNPTGSAATFSTQGAIDPTGEYFQAQGTNGRSDANPKRAQIARGQDLFNNTNPGGGR